ANKDAGYITTTFGGNAAVGVGLCGVVGAKGIVNASIAAKFNAERLNNIPAANSGEIKETEPLEGFLFKFGGGFGIDLLLFTLEYTPTLLTYGAGCYKKVAENSGSIIVLSQDANAGVRKAVDNGTSDMSSFGNNVQFMSGKDYTVNTLLSNARERTKPDIETLPDGRKMIVFLGNDANAAENNKCCLMYAIADKNGNWGAVQKVDGNGTNDILPQIVTFKDKAAVVWSDSNKVFDKDALPRDMLGSFEVAYRVFDCSTDTWGEKTVITNDGFMDTCAGFALNEDTNKLTCFYLKRDLQKAETDQELADINATYSTIAYKEYDINAKVWNTDEIYLDIKHDRITDPLIIDFSAKADKIDENNYIWMTYTVDEDENLQTSEDREVYAILRNVDGDTNAYPIRVTNNVFSDSNPALTKYNDEVYLSWLQDGKILKMADLTGIIKFLKENGHFDDYFEKTEKGIYKKSAGEIGISAEEYKKSVFDYLAKENLAGIEKNFRTEEYIDRSIGNYRLYSDSNNGLYLFWTEAGYTTSGKEQDPKTAELYAAIYEEDGGWGNSVKITDLGKYIDEFDIAFDGNDSMSAVSNLYSINIAESGEISYSSNDLVEIDFVKKTSLSPEKLSVNGIIRAGETVEISFDAVNNGLKSSGAYSVTAEYVSEGKSAVIFSKDEAAGLRSGECISYNFAFDIPSDVKDGAVKVTVTDNNTGQSESITEDVKAVSSIKVENENIYFDDERKPCISVKISNNSDTESGNIVLSANLPTDITKIYGSYEVGTLKGGESREVIYTLEDFDPKTDLERFGTANITNNCSEDNVKLSDNVLKLFALDAAELVIENDTDTISLAKGEEYIINASVVPANIANRTVTFSTDNDRVAIVTSEGKIIPVGNGTAVITVSHTSSGLKKTITVNASGFAEGTSESTTEEAHSETTTQSST
ncbi:MAG: hypothetical protein IJ583_01425, partial [Firmicutes bacterium]|nr:hypothetical protein [Bacillota bacterium]